MQPDGPRRYESGNLTEIEAKYVDAKHSNDRLPMSQEITSSIDKQPCAKKMCQD
ncbi:hypothetical protein NIES2135_63730 (plasmid) [Leptolyngbya boryana NIES-2135]|jgi:hypothetical protein|uniref:Uncharacterized protein n=1 Tax=Leptolyngbya boryana NIES-2135 TaxID=1973484 RepID=A0A1Z4JS32_LEPBY|nr:hypothetical protein NIES2135_63730 [Leptolyngbya boryana NIES-2135]